VGKLTRGSVAVQGATIYVSPDRPPILNGTLLAQDGRILTAGTADISLPPGTTVIPCQSCAVTAGFWNMHVHFSEPKWSWAEWRSEDQLDPQLAAMLTSRGFTTVVDLGSDPRDTVSLRRRIENGELRGPHIYTAATPLYPENGIPFYVRETTPRYLLFILPQPGSPAAATRDVERNIIDGADVVKLFTGTYVSRGTIKPMRVDIAREAVETAHLNRQIAFAHPSNLDGVNVALASGVDVLAHTPDTTDGINDELIGRMAEKAAMIPTLKMFGSTVTKKPSYLEPIYNIVRRFRADGGNLLFGTDVGYMTDYSTRDEFDALAQCGLAYSDMLKMLTTAPAARMGIAEQTGSLDPGKLADFVVLGSDPASNVQAFADVRATVRGGRILWQAAR
jgi:imidazolonepropionase-like amidohydrolase